MQMQRQLLAAELAHQLILVLDQNDLALVDDADPVGHLLRLVDVVGGEDDGDAGFAQRADHPPHVLAQLHVDAGGRLVEEEYLRLVRECFRNQHAALHAARERDDLGVLLVPERKVLEHLLDEGRVLALAEEAAAKGDRGPHGHESVGRELLRHQPDHRARSAIVRDDVTAGDGDAAGRRRHDPADDTDEGGLSGAVRSEQAENLARPDLEIDVLQRLEAGRVGLVEGSRRR